MDSLENLNGIGLGYKNTKVPSSAEKGQASHVWFAEIAGSKSTVIKCGGLLGSTLPTSSTELSGLFAFPSASMIRETPHLEWLPNPGMYSIDREASGAKGMHHRLIGHKVHWRQQQFKFHRKSQILRAAEVNATLSRHHATD